MCSTRCQLTPATYLVSTAITDATLLHVYDYRDRAFTLAVQPGKSPDRNGLVTLDGQWVLPIEPHVAHVRLCRVISS